jgi:hypothetical protein
MVRTQRAARSPRLWGSWPIADSRAAPRPEKPRASPLRAPNARRRAVPEIAPISSGSPASPASPAGRATPRGWPCNGATESTKSYAVAVYEPDAPPGWSRGWAGNEQVVLDLTEVGFLRADGLRRSRV